MRILVLGEGPNDLGHYGPDGSPAQLGAVPILVERLIRDTVPSLAIDFRVQPWKSLRAHRGTGFDRKLRLAYSLYGRQFSAIVGMIDRDGERYRSKSGQLRSGQSALLESGFPCAAGLNVETLEATLLADETALRVALNDPSIICQPDPESLTSRDEASDKNPKGRLRRLIVRTPAGQESNDFSMHYAKIARNADLRILEARCGSGFGLFATEVRSLAKMLAG